MLIILFGYNFCVGQIVVQGNVKDTANKSIVNATITIQLKYSKKIIAYTYTNEAGCFKVDVQDKCNTNNCIVKVNTLNFEIAEQEINSIGSATVTKNFILKEVAKNLSEVIVQSKPAILGNNDTINYNVENFSNKYDRSIGDVLQRLPGIEVMADGTIKYQGKSINKFYIDGKDLLAGRYNIATANVPSDAVEKVQVLEKHQPLKVLDSFSTSNRAAINIVLKEKARNRIIGKAKLGIGYPLLSMDNEFIPLFFNKNLQSIATIKYNNIGKDYANELKYLIFDDLDETILKNTALGEIVSISKPGVQSLDLDKFYSNKQFTTSINQLHTTKKSNELKYFLDFSNDQTIINGSIFTNTFFVNDTFRINEVNNFYQSGNKLKGKIDLFANKSHYNFSNSSNFQLTQTKINSVIINPKEIYQTLNYNNYNFSNLTKYSFSRRKQLFSFSFLLGSTQQPQTLGIKNMSYDTFFTKTPNLFFVLQEVTLKSFFISSNSSWFYKIKPNFSLSNIITFNYINNPYKTLITANGNDSLFKMKQGFSNNFLFNQFSIGYNVGVNYKLNKLQFSLNIPYTINTINAKQMNSPFENYSSCFTGIAASSNYTINKKWSLFATINNQFELMPSYMATDGYVIYTYRSIRNNNSIIQSSKDFNIESYLNYKNILRYTFITFSFMHNKSTNNTISDNHFINELNVIEKKAGDISKVSNRGVISLNKYVPKIKTSFTLQATFENVITKNYSNGIVTTFYNSNYQLFFKTNSNIGQLNIDTKTKFNVFANRNLQGYTNSFLMFEQLLTFKVPLFARFFAIFNSNCNIISPQNQKPTYFLYPDFFISYGIVKLKADFEIGGQNLLNKKTFTNLSFYGNTQTINQVELRPLQILIKATFYFK
ncbi:MAG: hypothetical protein JSR09_05790 [Bacteroidetes bacterium]|nr:hypothetical protein [Bacteroidota bacterium]MBS1649201.1 hypothetical protein [Bacteroidota bacterium]